MDRENSEQSRGGWSDLSTEIIPGQKGEYRGSRVSRIELRFNPMKRNLNGEHAENLNHIIHAAIRGMDRACTLEIRLPGWSHLLSGAPGFSPDLNQILLEKAIRYRNRGVIGIDLAGTEQGAMEAASGGDRSLSRTLRAGPGLLAWERPPFTPERPPEPAPKG